jgi:hypothetical protein
MGNHEEFPRELTAQERNFLLWLLPADRSGYLGYRELIGGWKVVGRGRRGEGNFILAAPGERPDIELPLPQLFALGVVESQQGNISVSLRERVGNQVEFEIVNLHGEGVPDRLQEVRRWTYSTWLPSQPCPACGGSVREVPMVTASGQRISLALCPQDKRLWVYEESSGVNHLIPVTNFYNELMLQKNVRDPSIALDWKRLFTDLGSFADAELLRAFAAYNKLRTKVDLESSIVVPQDPRRSWIRRLVTSVSPRKGEPGKGG